MSTLREHLETIRDFNHPMQSSAIDRVVAFKHAVAALAILSAAEKRYPDVMDTGMGGREPIDQVYTPEGAAIYRSARATRLVPDPEPPPHPSKSAASTNAAPRPSTLREIHERCKTRHVTTDTSDRIPDQGLCDHCLRKWPCVDYEDAVAALAILDASKRLGNLSQRIYPADDHVAVPDPEPSA